MTEDNVRPFKRPAKKAPAKKAAKKAPAKRARKAPAKKVVDAAELEVAMDKLREEAEQAERDALTAAEDQRFRAHRLRLTGLSWREVAKRAEYPTEKAAEYAVSEYREQAFAERSAEQRQQAFVDQVERYHTTLAAWWDKANVELDANAATVVLRTLAQLDKLHRLGEPDAVQSVRALVIAGSPEEYAAQLRQFVLEREGAKAIEGGRS